MQGQMSRTALAARALLLLAITALVLYSTTKRHAPGAILHSASRGGFAGVDVATQAAFSGRVAKHGPLAMLSALEKGRTRAELCYPEPWRAARAAKSSAKGSTGGDSSGSGSSVAPVVHPHKWCSIMWNDKYKLIYTKCTKTAGTTLVNYFSSCADNPAPEDRCLRFANLTSPADIAHLLEVWDDYFVFSFSRNVLRRAISQYQYLTHFMDAACAPSWADHCRDPYILGDICRQRGPSGKLCCTQSPEHQYTHASPQVNCFVDSSNQSALDWLGRVENFEEDLAALIGILNARKGVPQLPQQLPKKANYNQSPCQQQQQAARRRLAWDVVNGTFNPCDKVGGLPAGCRGPAGGPAGAGSAAWMARHRQRGHRAGWLPPDNARPPPRCCCPSSIALRRWTSSEESSSTATRVSNHFILKTFACSTPERHHSAALPLCM